MDEAAFTAHHQGEQGGQFQAAELPQLTTAGQPLYHFLLRTNARLEQEKLPLAHVTTAVAQATGHPTRRGAP